MSVHQRITYVNLFSYTLFLLILSTHAVVITTRDERNEDGKKNVLSEFLPIGSSQDFAKKYPSYVKDVQFFQTNSSKNIR